MNKFRSLIILSLLILTAWSATASRLWAENEPAANATAAGVIKGQIQHDSVKRSKTLIYVVEATGEFKIPEKPEQIKQAGKTFVPSVLPVLAGTKVVFTNDDSFNHNVFSPDFPPKQKGKRGANYYDLGTWGQGETRSFTFKQPGVYTQLCAIHPEMVGYVVVLQNPYFAIVDKDGKFSIPNVPAGNYKLKVWNERLRPQQLEKTHDVKVEQGGESNVVVNP